MEIKGAEIFAAGSWNNLAFSVEDLDAIVAAFEAFNSEGRVPLKFGHDADHTDTDGKPAIGWARRVWREGEKLLADLSDVPRIVYEAINKGLYKFVSVELLKGVEREGKKFAWVLDAIALLGADIPAVSTLKDLQALTLSRKPGVRFDARVAFSRQEKLNARGGEDRMTEEELKAAQAKLAAEQAALAADKAKIETERAEFKRKEDEQAKEAAKVKLKTHRDTLTAKFDSAVKAGTITSAQRESGMKLLKFTDDAKVLEVKDEDVDEYVKSVGKAPKKQGRESFSREGSEAGGDDPDLTMADKLAEEMDGKVKEGEAGTESTFGPQDAARFGRKNRELVRSWMNELG